MNYLYFYLIAIQIHSYFAVRTTRNEEIAVCNGYQMTKKGVSRDGQTQFWNCIRRNECNGRAHSAINSLDLHEVTPHRNHEPNAHKLEDREMQANLKTEARENARIPPRNLIDNARTGASEEAAMAITNYDAMQRKIFRSREIEGEREVNVENLLEIVIQDQFAVDHENNPFLLHDSRINEPEDVVFFIFCTVPMLQRLQQHRHWAFDGTFKVSPTNFMQLYTINMLIETSSVPAIYVFMGNRMTDTYARVFTVVRENTNNIVPDSIMMDFEAGAKAAVFEVWGNGVKLRHCLFHLAQSVFRRVSRDGLRPLYADNHDFRKAIRSLPALAFLNANEIPASFEELRNAAPIQVAPIFDYFKRTYIVRTVNNDERDPPFPMATWNAHDAVLENLARTNNAMEGWHRVFRQYFLKEHPRFSKVILALKEENKLMENRLRPYEIDHTRGLAETRRLQKYVENDAAIRRLIQAYDALAPAARNVVHHLRALQYRLAKSDFEAID